MAQQKIDGTQIGAIGAWKGGTLVHRAVAQLIPNNVTTIISWDVEDYDTAGIHSVSTPSRLTVPAGVSKVRLSFRVVWWNNSSGTFRSVSLTKNGSAGNIGTSVFQSPPNVSSLNNVSDGETTPVLIVTPGDYFEISVGQDSGASLNVINASIGIDSWFGMEIVE